MTAVWQASGASVRVNGRLMSGRTGASTVRVGRMPDEAVLSTR